jgi:small subunit ribosomal protein S9
MKGMAERRTEYWGTGKRKTAVARVRLFSGDGTYTVNHQPLITYFGRETARMIVQQPFVLTQTEGQYDVIANVRGGGNSAQASAIRHGVTHALLQMNPELRPALKKAGYITRDSREVERKKYGKHKARKRPQYSKR